MRFLIAITMILATLLLVIERQSVDAVCCNAGCGSCAKKNLCADCTRPTPCCGHGKCNIFCCNCDGGCRSGKGCDKCLCPAPPPPPYFRFASPKAKCPSKNTAAQQLKAQRESEAHVQNILASCDVDRDGRLTLQETQAWVSQNKPAHLREAQYVQSEFSKLDLNRDGFITADEIDP